MYGNKTPNPRKGRCSGGISIYMKQSLKILKKSQSKKQFDILWVKLSSELFSFNEEGFICNVHITPAHSNILSSNDFNVWDEIEKGIKLYSMLGKVYITGGMNGRTSNFADILGFDKYIEHDGYTF